MNYLRIYPIPLSRITLAFALILRTDAWEGTPHYGLSIDVELHLFVCTIEANIHLVYPSLWKQQ